MHNPSSLLKEMRIIRARRGNLAAMRRALSPVPPVDLRLHTADVILYANIMLDQEYAFEYPASPNLIIDAGAHIGLSAVWFARRFPNATIIAVELEPSNFALLEANVRRLPQVHPVHAALWPISGSVAIADPKDGNWAYRATAGQGVSAVSVPDLMERYNIERIGLLKLDIEGSECEILGASSPWIDRVDMIVAELHDRFREGCTAAFDRATADFTHVAERGENVLAARV
jgi:FkbM family methyltransferase